MNSATFNTIVAAAEKAELISMVDFAEMMEEAECNKREVAKQILSIAFNDGINTGAYEKIKNAYNAHLKAAA